MASWIEEVTRELLRAWRRVEPKPARPEIPLMEAAEGSADLPLGSPGKVGGTLKPGQVAAQLPPVETAVRVPPWRKRRGAGQIEMWTPARVALRGGGQDVPPLVIDPTLPPPEERWVWERREDGVIPRERSARHWSRGGYRWPRHNEPAMEKPRRQYLLRTDLARLTYPKLPSPGRLMRPMLATDDPVEPWRPLREELPIELTAEDMRWWRFMDHRVGAPELPRPRWRSAISRGAEARPPEAPPAEGPGEPDR